MNAPAATAPIPTDPKELSVAIAQEVMGWCLKQSGTDPEAYGAPIMAWIDKAGARRAWATPWFDNEPYSPATNHDEAFSLVQLLLLLDYTFSYDSYPGDPEQMLVPSHGCCVTAPDGHDTGEIIGKTMPEVICCAALKAVRMYGPKKGTPTEGTPPPLTCRLCGKQLVNSESIHHGICCLNGYAGCGHAVDPSGLGTPS